MLHKYLIENCGFNEEELKAMSDHPILLIISLGALIGVSFLAYTILVSLLLAF